MPSNFATADWETEIKGILSTDEVKSAVQGIDLDMVMQVGPTPDIGLESNLNLLMSIHGGDVVQKVISQADADAQQYVFGYDYATMKGMMKGTVQMQAAFMQGKVKLVKGDMSSLMTLAPKMAGLTSINTKIADATVWPDELSGGDLDAYKKALADKLAAA